MSGYSPRSPDPDLVLTECAALEAFCDREICRLNGSDEPLVDVGGSVIDPSKLQHYLMLKNAIGDARASLERR